MKRNWMRATAAFGLLAIIIAVAGCAATPNESPQQPQTVSQFLKQPKPR